MAAINPTDGDILGVAASDVLELYRGNKQEVKRVTVEELLRVIGNPGDVSGAWSDAIVAVDVAGDPTVSDNHVLSTFGDVTLTDCYESAMFAWRVYRRGSTDAESNAVRLFEFDVHYRISQMGTYPEIPVR